MSPVNQYTHVRAPAAAPLPYHRNPRIPRPEARFPGQLHLRLSIAGKNIEQGLAVPGALQAADFEAGLRFDGLHASQQR